jgi:hypothetical protein
MAKAHKKHETSKRRDLAGSDLPTRKHRDAAGEYMGIRIPNPAVRPPKGVTVREIREAVATVRNKRA